MNKKSTSKIIGRLKEQAILGAVLKSKKSEFVALYGRRRVIGSPLKTENRTQGADRLDFNYHVHGNLMLPIFLVKNVGHGITKTLPSKKKFLDLPFKNLLTTHS